MTRDRARRTGRGDGCGRDERVREGWMGRGGAHVHIQLRKQRTYTTSCGGPQAPLMCNTVCFSVLRIVAVLHRCHVCVTHPMRHPTTPTHLRNSPYTGMSLLEGEGWPSQAMRRVAPRRREPLCSGPCSAKTCGRQLPHAACCEKLCATPCRVEPFADAASIPGLHLDCCSSRDYFDLKKGTHTCSEGGRRAPTLVP